MLAVYLTIGLALFVAGSLFAAILVFHRRHMIDDVQWDHARDPAPRPETPEGRAIAFEITALRVCIVELITRAEEEPLRAWIWETKLNVAQLILTELTGRIDWEPQLQLTPEQRQEILEQHPLLQSAADAPPDPAKRYAHQQWFRQIRREVTEFTEAAMK